MGFVFWLQRLLICTRTNWMGAGYACWHGFSLENHTWELFPWPQGKNIVKCQWVYKTKFTSEGVFENHESHLVVKGFSQQEGIEYTENFYPIAKMNSIRLILVGIFIVIDVNIRGSLKVSTSIGYNWRSLQSGPIMV
jgi:hypothetical protein